MLANSLISIIEEEIEKTEKIISERIQTSKKLIKISTELEEYLMLETKLINYIMSLSFGGNGKSNLNPNQIRTYNNYDKKKALKMLRKKLNEKFIELDNSRADYLYLINSIFYTEIMKQFDPEDSIILIGKNCNEEEKQSFIFYEKICKVELKKIDDLLIQKLNNELKKTNEYIKVNKIPDFILYDLHEILKQKIFIQWSINYRILLKDLILSDKEDTDFKYIYQIYRDFFNDKLTLFDPTYLFKNQDENMKLKTILFNAIYLSNSKVINSSSNQKTFFNNVTKYLLLLGFDKTKCRFSQIITNCMKSSNNNNGKDKAFKNLINLISVDKNGKIFMYIIWCLSMIFNNIIFFDENDNKISFAPFLKCSARAKIFFYNFLNNFDNYIQYHNMSFNNSAIYYNSQIENYVFAELTKSYTKVLYDEQNRYKINLTTKKIFKYIERLSKTEIKNAKKSQSLLSFWEDEDDYEDELLEDCFDYSSLDEIESSQLYLLYIQFMKEYIVLENKNKDNNTDNLLNALLCNKSNKHDSDEINLRNVLKFKFNDELLIPVDMLNTATQIMICISGGEDDDNGKSDIFNYILNERNSESIDYYIYKWSKNNQNNIKENIAIIYGKLLAYIISSREIFKFQTISFLTVGDGSIVLKSCLNELSTKINSIIDATDIIQDIIIIDSKISYNLDQIDNIFNLKLVAGKFINVYINKEFKVEIPKDINVRMSYSIVGINPSKNKMDGNDYFINCLPEIYNFDLVNDLKINNKYYLVEINNILKKIKGKIYSNY
jgi:hypothetical protein